MKNARKPLILAAAAALALFGTSCHDPYGHTGTGAVAGGLIGAGVGAIVGNQSHRPLEGAAIGGAIGALGGAVLGSSYRGDSYGYRRSGYYSGGGYCAPPPPRSCYGGGY